ncbi:hypothetical protein YC2023_120040 [Brassica napus]
MPIGGSTYVVTRKLSSYHSELPSPLKELLDTPRFRVLIRVANGMIALTSTGAHVDHTITGKPGHSFTEYMVKTNTVSIYKHFILMADNIVLVFDK